jgi:hypothetical protein
MLPVIRQKNKNLLNRLFKMRLDLQSRLPLDSALKLHYAVDNKLCRCLLQKNNAEAVKQCFELIKAISKGPFRLQERRQRSAYCKSLIDLLLAGIPIIAKLSDHESWVLELSARKMIEHLLKEWDGDSDPFDLFGLVRFINVFNAKEKPLLVNETSILKFLDGQLPATFSEQNRLAASKYREDVLTMFRFIKQTTLLG